MNARRLTHVQIALLALAIALLWPTTGAIVAGLDPSWMAALHMAPQIGLRYGSDVVFTYGPLGYLTVPFAYSPRIALYVLVQAITFVGSTVVVAVVLRRHVAKTWLLSTIVICAIVLAPLSSTNAVEELLAAGCCFWVLSRRHRLTAAVMAVSAAIGALVLLVKFNDGVSVIAVTGATVLWSAVTTRAAVPAARLAGTYLAAFVAFVVALWLIAGQRLGDLVTFVTGSFELSAAYSRAMSTVPATTDIAMFALVVVTLALVVLGGRLPLLPTLVWGFFAYKRAVVRPDSGHLLSFPIVIVFLAILALDPSLPPPRRLGRRLPIALMAGGLALVSTLYFESKVPTVPLVKASGLPGAIATLARGGDTPHDATTRAAVASAYRLGPSVRQALEAGAASGSHIDVQPVDEAVIWALGLEKAWNPLPIFQGYIAFDPSLDARNAKALREEGADLILLRTGPIPDTIFTIDGRRALWDPPTTVRTMMCRYGAVVVEGPWAVARRLDHDRCGTPAPLSSRPASVSTAIALDNTRTCDGIVSMQFSGVEHALPAKGLATLFRSPVLKIDLASPGRTDTFRVPPDQLAAPLAISGTLPPDWQKVYPDLPADIPTSLQFRLDGPEKALAPLLFGTGTVNLTCQQIRPEP